MKKPTFTKTDLRAKWIFCFLFLSGSLFASNNNHKLLSNSSLCENTENKPLTLGLSLSVQNPTCYSFTNGAIYTSVSGGTPPYFYLWDDPGASTAPHLLGVGAGIYTVIVTDATGDIITDAATVTEPSDIIAIMEATDAFCSMAGTATVAVSGGVGPYTYSMGQWFNQ